jgi:hypothetical protein
MFTQQPDPKRGEENGPFTILGATATNPGRLYTQSGTQDAGEHHEGSLYFVMSFASIHSYPPIFRSTLYGETTKQRHCNQIQVLSHSV